MSFISCYRVTVVWITSRKILRHTLLHSYLRRYVFKVHGQSLLRRFKFRWRFNTCHPKCWIAVSLTRISHSILEANQVRAVNFNAIEFMVRPGIYKDIHAIVSEINNLNCTKNHVEFRVERGGYVTCARVFTNATCYQLSHQLFLSKKLQKILGFEKMSSIFIKDQESIEGDRHISPTVYHRC